MDLLEFLVRFPDYKVVFFRCSFRTNFLFLFETIQGIRDIFKQLLEKVQMLMSHTPIQDIEKVFKFYTVKTSCENSTKLKEFLRFEARRADHEPGQ